MSSSTASPQPQLTIWQWNCIYFPSKRFQLTPFTQLHQPDVLALQETETSTPTLQGYDAHISAKRFPRTAILTAKTLTPQVHEITSPVDHVLIEIVPQYSRAPSIFILNIYCSPTQPLGPLGTLLRAALNHAARHPLLLLGNFNAPHTACGYHQTRKKGADLLDIAQNHTMTLWNDIATCTRIGNSVTRDTFPDLTFSHIPHIDWQCLEKTLGSDHRIISITLPYKKAKTRIGQAIITDWAAFRKDPQPLPTTLTDLETWTQQLLKRADKHTK